MTKPHENAGTSPATAGAEQRPAYESPRILKKRAVDHVTLGGQFSGKVTSSKKGGGTFGGE
jgi:hypothetical protein